MPKFEVISVATRNNGGRQVTLLLAIADDCKQILFAEYYEGHNEQAGYYIQEWQEATSGEHMLPSFRFLSSLMTYAVYMKNNNVYTRMDNEKVFDYEKLRAEALRVDYQMRHFKLF